jgi:purine-binding chemotaxis protein CheW
MSVSQNTQANYGASPEEAGQEFLTFSLGAEEYAIEILKVQEIREREATTRIAGAPLAIQGVVNLRGNIIPIMDLRIALCLADNRPGGGSVVIIVNLAQQTIGMVVDGVSDVVRIPTDALRPVPVAAAVDARHLRGIGMHEGRMIILLDVESVLGMPASAAATATAGLQDCAPLET